MARIGRNDPCPCGSGKKYKKCCLPDEQEASRESHDREQGVEAVFRWLVDHHEEEVDAAVEKHFLMAFGDRGFDLVDELPPAAQRQIIRNARDWLVAEGVLEIDGEEVSALGLYLDRQGEELTDLQRRWLDAVAAAELELYNVAEIHPDGAYRLELAWAAPGEEDSFEVTFRERPDAGEGAKIGLRLVPWEGGHHPTSAYYRVTTWAMEEPDPTRPVDPDNPLGLREIDAQTIVEVWLREMVEKHLGEDAVYDIFFADPDELDDEEDPYPHGALVADLYEIRDQDALLAAFAGEPTIEQETETSWTLLSEEGGSLAALGLNPGEGDEPPQLNAASSTEKRADRAQDRLLELAGESLRFLRREMIDLGDAVQG